ncbi:MAG TPA: hypothetical protein VF598_11405 [Hymenobacter sp.]
MGICNPRPRSGHLGSAPLANQTARTGGLQIRGSNDRIINLAERRAVINPTEQQSGNDYQNSPRNLGAATAFSALF